ncbi:uncharacterized protein GIQ15_04521 [Arthroderma uncinatum]|uniref:uncharacterized protein n=1 Tax=Arthroderma uncinatum TaxID=74035 RepID=UPI00144A7157|nr:uncharacterized protein GIQ15_04521 [Arthroderma uncinatum]KAF3481762.1 hypothetical protein GIQ15_04521 [Arthroderma uncinatum]
MLGDERPGMARSTSSTSVRGVLKETTEPAVSPAKAEAAPQTAPKPAPEEGSSSEDKDAGFLMHPKGVYIVISENKHFTEKFHWGIIVARSQNEGILYHRVFDGSDWVLEIEEHKDIPADKSVMVILKVGDVPEVTPQWIEAIQECIVTAQVPRMTMGPVTCRTFALAAAYEMGNGGFTNLYPNWSKVKGIEREGNQFAWHASNLGRRLVVASQWCDL